MDKRFPRPLLPLPRRVNYHVWSIRTITSVAVIVIILTATSVFLFGKRSIFRETELTLGIIALSLFIFLAVGLHRGVRVKRWDLPGVDTNNVSMQDILENLPSSDLGDLASGAADAEGCLGAIVGLILTVLVGVLLVFLLWIVLNFGVMLWVFLMAALSWVFFLALRQVFAKSRVCRGNWGRSLAYALFYTALYTGWLFALVAIAEGIWGSRIGKG